MTTYQTEITVTMQGKPETINSVKEAPSDFHEA